MEKVSLKKLDHIDHLALTVSDLDRSIKWYQTSFNCELLYRDNRQAALRFDNLTLCLTLPSNEPTHLAFQKADAETFGELRKQYDGRESTFLADPTGNLIELIKG